MLDLRHAPTGLYTRESANATHKVEREIAEAQAQSVFMRARTRTRHSPTFELLGGGRSHRLTTIARSGASSMSGELAGSIAR